MTNKLSLHRIIDIQDRHLQDFEELYVLAFPPEERRDLPNLRHIIASDHRFHPHAILMGEQFVGLLTWWNFGDFLYGEHFATTPEVRNQGLGATSLEFIKHDALSRPILIEVEPPTDELPRRRIAFYNRMGLRLLDTPYLQPPYRLGDSSTPLSLMLYGEADDKYLQKMIEIIHREVYGCE